MNPKQSGKRNTPITNAGLTMGRKQYLVTVKGNNSEWVFKTLLHPDDVPDYKADGIEIIPCYYEIPNWAFIWRVERIVMFAQDIFHFRNPFRK